MPFYTFIISFNNKTYVAQGRYSNIKSFVPGWLNEMPKGDQKTLTKDQRNFLAGCGYREEWIQVPDKKHVWRQTIKLDAGDFVVYAIQTAN
ncbi:MAG: hypothetical protein EPN97_04435 [Alphaproteobacteria bacterium]|nr:MAG: hypothetical protein EPN97_04435 [Alphaproteobacteria bacterium]